MARRSDFAQKLLDDLRQRKERLASSSQSSNRSSTSSTAVLDAYSYARKNYRRSKDTRTNDMTGAGTGNARPRSSAGNRSSFVGDSGQHIVPYNYGGARSSHQIGDLSIALSLALQNGGRTGRTDSSTTSFALEFLQQIGVRPAQTSKMETRGGNSQRFQAVQIDEIAKGANRLNQILRACSNGVNLDQFSIQIGKDLLKGAVDLENSLKMLVDLQEAPGKLAEPQRKNRIKLLEEDEEEDRGAAVAEEWRLDRPRFSFDRTEKLGSHSRSASFGANAISSSTLGEFKPKPSTSTQKARIPSVIAKLMGLENLPEVENSRSVSSTVGAKAKEEIRNMSGRKETASLAKKLRVEAETSPFVVNSSFMGVRERTVPSNFRFDVVSHGEKPTTRSEMAAPRKERAQEMSMKNNPPAKKERQHQPPVRDRNTKLTVSPARKPKGSEASSMSALSKSNKPTQLNKEKPNKKSPKRRSTNSVQSELPPNVQHQDEVFRDRNSVEATAVRLSKLSNSEQSSPKTEPILKRIKVPKSYNEHKLSQRVDDIVPRRSVRNPSSAPKEAKNPRRREKLLKEEARDEREVIKEAKKRFGVFTLKEDVRTRMEEPAQEPNQDVSLDDQPNQARLCEDQELLDIENGLNETMNVDANATQAIEQTEPAEEPITLTDSEDRLKDILVKSPLFLNTAVALFDLEIPIDVFQPSSHDDENAEIGHASHEKEQRRLALDCGYELMRRKGRRQELSLYPNHAKATIGLVKIRAFDGLVRELSRDFEKLRVHGGFGGAEEYLPAMQERDVHGRELDVNCMWDLGWSESFFAFIEVGDVARDVEKFVLNTLLDEITGQLLLHCL